MSTISDSTQGSQTALRQRDYRGLGLVCLILAGAIVLRLWDLGGQNLWFDEALSLIYARYPLQEIPTKLAEKSTNPPLYFCVLNVWRDLGLWTLSLWSSREVAESEAWLRFPSVIFSLLSIPVAGRIARELFDRTTGLITMLLMAISAFQIHYAQEARMYALMMFLGTISFWFFLKLTRKPTLGGFLGYVVFSSALMYTHIFGIFSVLGQAAFYLSDWLSHWRKGTRPDLSLKVWVASQLAVGILFDSSESSVLFVLGCFYGFLFSVALLRHGPSLFRRLHSSRAAS